MFTHPFTESLKCRAASVLITLSVVAVNGGLLMFYGGTAAVPAFVDSIVSVGLLAAAGYAAWFALVSIHIWQVKIMLMLFVQCISLGVSYAVLSLADMADTAFFLKSLPLRVLFGLLCWTILLQWYRFKQKADEVRAEAAEAEERRSRQPAPELVQEAQEIIDRITVKDGSRIHIIRLEELLCLQSSGDYVTLFTPAGQYIKEQTMKYFETHLPAVFVRIHRSAIVNTNHILRVELFGKENYQVKLKNGISLRASIAGYKLLKERLAL